MKFKKYEHKKQHKIKVPIPNKGYFKKEFNKK